MKQIKSYSLILFKKTLNTKAFIALILLVPIVGLGLSLFGSSSSESSNVIYLYSESNDDFSNTVLNNITSSSEGYSFVIASSEEEIKTSVKSYKALCGYILVKDQPKLIENHQTNGNIILVERMGNAKTDTVNEIVFSYYFREYAKYYAKNHIEDNENTFEDKYNELMTEALENYTVEKLSSNETKSGNDIIRNIIAVMLCLFSMLSLVNFITDCEHGILYPIPRKSRVLFRFIYFFIPLLTIYPVALLTIALFNNHHGVVLESLYLLIYELLLVLLCVMASYIVKHRIVMFGIIPVFTLLYVIICPVFVDLSNYLPIVNILRYLCPPYYYMGI